MSTRNTPISNASERPDDWQAAGRLGVCAPSGIAPSITPADAPPEFANPHAAVADMRRQTRAKARQMVTEAKLALLESLQALHAAENTDAASPVAGSAPNQRGVR